MKGWGTSTRIAIVPVCLLLVLCATVATGCGSKLPAPPPPLPPPPTIRKIVDPSVTVSPAISKYVTMISRARQHAYNESLADYSHNFGAYTTRHRAALDDLRRARAIQPKNDGSKQWRLASKYASRVRYEVSYEDRLHKDALAYNAAAWNKDLPAYNRAVQRVQSADKAYSAYVFQFNWAGYCAIGRRFTRVTATWTVPQLHVNGTTARRVSIWVGLDGKVPGSNTVEQTGIRCILGESYVAWYEMFPKPPVTIHTASTLDGPQDMVVNAGDTVTATVTSLGGHRFKLTLVDGTQGESFSIVKTS